MVDTVTFSTDIGGTGETFTSGSDPTTGMGNGGYLTRFFKILANVIAVAAFIATKAAEAAASALTAVNAPGTNATSSSGPLALVNTGDVAFTIQSGKAIVPGQYFRAQATGQAATFWMSGFVKSYAGTALVVTMDSKGAGTGSFSSWILSLAAVSSGAVPMSRTLTGQGLVAAIGDMSADRNINVPASTTAQARALASTTVALTPGVMASAMLLQQVTDGANLDVDLSLKPYFYVIIAGNRIVNRLTGGQKGRWYYGEVWQDATGSRLLTWTGSGAFNFRRAGTPYLSTTPNKRDAFALFCTDDTVGANAFDVYFGRAE